MAIDESKILTLENIFTKAQDAAGIGDGDYIYFQKTGAGAFSRIEKSLFMQGVGSGSTGVAAKVKDNVDILQAKIDEIVVALNTIVAYAFDGTKPNISEVGALDWSGSDTPQDTTPSLVVSSSSLSFSTNLGTAVQKTFTVKGANLTGNINLAITQMQGFSINPAIISSDLNGTHTITVTYNPNAVGTNTATVIISSAGATSKQVTLNGTAVDAETADLTINLTGDKVTSSVESGKVAIGNSLSIQLGTNDNLYVVDEDNVSVTMGGVNITSSAYNKNTDTITINNVTGDIAVNATAMTYIQNGLVMMLDGKNQGDTANQWANIANANYPLELSGTGFSKESDHIEFNGGSSGDAGFATGIMQDFGFNKSYDASTSEAVYSQTSALSSAAILVTGRNNGTVIGITSSGNNKVLFARVAGEHAADASTACGILTSYGSNQIVSVSHSGLSYHLNNTALNTGGAVALTIGDSGSTYDMAGRMAVGGLTSRNNTYVFPFAGNIYCLRLYDRVLTASEIGQNYKVDKKRFNIS